MQLNPHFLFNTMNGISSLMRSDIQAADLMLEQLSRLLRITLQRGDAQFIPLSDEMEFIEMYLAMQDRRFAGRVRQELEVDPKLHDALVPAMILQPIVENAYAHGLSKMNSNGLLAINASREGCHLKIRVTNTGPGLHVGTLQNGSSGGVGLSNVKDRLRMHYGDDQSFSICQIEDNAVRVQVTLPLQYCDTSNRKTHRVWCMMIQAVLADDEVLARQKLRQLLREVPEIEVVGEGATAAETIDLVRVTKPDLLFLDIRMPDMDGFDIIGELSSAGAPNMPCVIFTTAYDQYALRAFDIQAADYLLKPFSAERFRAATERAVQHIKSAKQSPQTAAPKSQNGSP